MPDAAHHIDAYMQDMTNEEQVAFLRERISKDEIREKEAVAAIASFLPVTSAPAKTLAYLYARRNRIVSYEALQAHVESFADPSLWIDRTYIAQYVKKIRRALRKSDIPLEITTHYDIGYCLCCPPDWVAPWENLDQPQE